VAGYYADVPGNRFAIDQDGTYIALKNNSTGVITDISSNANLFNDEDNDYFEFGSYAEISTDLIIYFPEARDLSGYFLNFDRNNPSPGQSYYSTDTTDGQDGTWVPLANPFLYYYGGNILPNYRTQIKPLSLSGVKGLRFTFTPHNSGYNQYLITRLYAIHIYGQIQPGANDNRLAFWDQGLGQECGGGYFDFGDLAQGQTSTKTFRLKNLSSTLTANNITVASVDVSTGMQVTFSTDGTNFSNNLVVGSLAPGTVSSTLYCKTTVDIAEPIRVEAAHMSATAATWS
jgi:hypothetical protein